MIELYYSPLDPFSRTARLILGEYGETVNFIEERVWDRRYEFLALNPAGTVPVMIEDDGPPICGINAIAEYLDETRPANARGWQAMPRGFFARAEVRRLVDWFDRKFNLEVTVNILGEKIDKRFLSPDAGGGALDMKVVHIGTTNLRYHLKYTDHLLASRNWLAGDLMTRADLTAAAHLSCLDYLGHVPWETALVTKDWYARLKSRPCFRALLTDRIAGIQPVAHYVDLDF